MTTLSLKQTTWKTKSLTLAIAVFAAVALPQLFHAIGIITGTGASLGTAFLPMQIPVFLAGLIGGPIIGLAAGMISPLVSFLISGMPTQLMLPFIMLELAAYGLSAGLLTKKNMPVFFKLLTSQVVGRMVRILAILIAIYMFHSSIAVTQIWDMMIVGLPGIALQWALIPLLMKGFNQYD